MLPAVDPHGRDHRPAGRRLRPGPDPGRPAAGDRRPGRAVLLRRGPGPGARSTWPPPSGSGRASPTRPPGGCCGRRSSICPRSCCSCCSTRCRPDDRRRPVDDSIWSRSEGFNRRWHTPPLPDHDRDPPTAHGRPHDGRPSRRRSRPARWRCGCSWPPRSCSSPA